MKKKHFIAALILAIIATGSAYSGLNSGIAEWNDLNKKVTTYRGSDPKGDYIEIEITRGFPDTITHINHTTGGTTLGPYPFTAVPPDHATGGFSNVYRADVSHDAVDHIWFVEYEDAMVIYQQFDASHDLIGNPEFAVISSPLLDTELVETAYNFITFDYKNPILPNSGMSFGFGAFDLDGRFYGANLRIAGSTGPAGLNISSITDTLSLDRLDTNSVTGTRFTHLNGGMGVLDKLVLVGTPSDSIILDFGPSVNGTTSSGLMLRQAATEAWVPDYDGTYFAMVYRYQTPTAAQEIGPYRFVFSGGHLNVFDFGGGLLTSLHFTPLLPSFRAGFAAESGNGAALSPVVHDAHLGYGSFAGSNAIGSVRAYIMFEPGGRYGGISLFRHVGAPDDFYLFGLMVKDPAFGP